MENLNGDKNIKVGAYREIFNFLTDQQLPLLDIVQSTGLEKHILKRHPNYIEYMDKIPEILLIPDYIGHNPKEPESIELVKVYEDNIQIAVKLDSTNDYYYVASLYEISNKKLSERLHSGRLKIFTE